VVASAAKRSRAAAVEFSWNILIVGILKLSLRAEGGLVLPRRRISSAAITSPT
jgi:hypothetical protein